MLSCFSVALGTLNCLSVYTEGKFNFGLLLYMKLISMDKSKIHKNFHLKRIWDSSVTIVTRPWAG
jgi:hypothetical protein